MCSFATTRKAAPSSSPATIFIILTRKRRDMLHKMVVLASISFLTLLCTFVFKVSPIPTNPAILHESGISKTELPFDDNLGETDSMSTQNDNPGGEKEGGSPSSVLLKHHRLLQFTNDRMNSKEATSSTDTSYDVDMKNRRDDSSSGSLTPSGIPDTVEGMKNQQHSENFDKLIISKNDHGEESKVIQMDTGSSSEHEKHNVHIPNNSVEDDTNDPNLIGDNHDVFVDSQYATIPNESIKFIGENKLPLSPQNGNRNFNSAGRVIEKSNRVPKPNRNASYRNTSEIPVRRLPQAIIIGVKKSGTRALLEFIRMHPDVEGSGPEPHFFDRNYDKGLEWYRSLMPKTYEDQVTIEKTPSYFVTQEAPLRILQMNPDVKLILVVRDPVTRAISDYCQAVSKRRAMPPFERMAMLDQRRGVVNATWGAIRIGLYYKHMVKWLETFRREQIHLVDMQKLITEPAKELTKVERFLHLSPFITEGHFYLHKFKGLFPCLIRKGKTHCLDGRSKGREHPKVKQSVLKRLRRFYAPFNGRFYQMVGRDFGWPAI